MGPSVNLSWCLDVVGKEWNIKLLANLPVTNPAVCQSLRSDTWIPRLTASVRRLQTVDFQDGPVQSIITMDELFYSSKQCTVVNRLGSQRRRGVFCEVGIEILNSILSNFSLQWVATVQFLNNLVAIRKLLSRME